MKINQRGASLIALIVSGIHTFADVRPVQLSLQCSNVVLSWPTQPGETFTVQYRTTVNTNTPWVTLTNLLRAAVSTNITTFVHSNVTDCTQAGGGGAAGGGGGSPPSPAGAQSASSQTTMTGEERAARHEELRKQAEAMAEYLMAMLKEAIAKAEADRQKWKLEGRPIAQTATASDPGDSPEEGGGESATSMGFYRVFKTSPTANADFFGIQQDSGANQLGIFDNDFDPDDDVLLLSNLSSASHGTLEYTDNASTFHYTPVTGFYGTDSFTYTITNLTGGRATATVTVFVSQSGNTRPSIAQPIITLPTNVHTATISSLSGATDPDNDTVSLVAVTNPRLGTVTNIAGQFSYTHPSNYFGEDRFDYFLTDGRGGLTRVPVSILQADTDNDGMADEWEMLFGLDPAVNDSNADPDGDGLPNLAEYKLGTDPRYPYNPLNLDRLTTGQAFSNTAHIPLSLNAPIGKWPISLLMNGDTASAFLQQGADGGWFFAWDTGYLTNGNYSVAAAGVKLFL